MEEMLKQARGDQIAAERRQKELEREVDAKDVEIGGLKKDLIRKDKITEDRVKQAMAGQSSLLDQKTRLEK